MRTARVTAIWLGLGVVATIGVLALNVGGPDTWRELGVPVITPRFADARIITAAAECDDSGFDPLAHNPCDLGNRVLNYPRVWVDIGRLVGSVDALAVLFTLAFLAGVTLAFRNVRPGVLAIAAFAFAIFNPAAMLGLERANNDLIVVGTVAAAAVLVARRTTIPFVIGSLLLVASSALKLYPIAVLPILFVVAAFDDNHRQRRRNLSIASGTTVLVIAIFLLQASDIGLIFDNAAKPLVYSYGIGGLVEFVDKYGFAGLVGDGAAFFVVAMLVAIVVPWMVPRQRRAATPFSNIRERCVSSLRNLSDSEHGVLFLSGLLLFAATMFLDNYPYKLIVLVLVLPLCVSAMDARNGVSRGVSWRAACLVGVIGLLWVLVPLERGLFAPPGTPLSFPGQAFAVLLVFVLCVSVLALGIAHAAAASPSAPAEDPA